MIVALAFALLFTVQSTLDQMSQAHANVLIQSDSLYHSDISPLVNGGLCSWAGEVIYSGPDPDQRWEAYAASPSHNKVVNHPRTHHGVGIAQDATGRYVVVDIFCEAVSTPPPTPTTTTPPRTTTAPPAPKTPEPPPPTTTTTTPRVLSTRAPPTCPSLFHFCVD